MKKRFNLPRRKLFLLLFLLTVFLGLIIFLSNHPTDSKRFSSLTEQLFREEMTSNTLNMHYTLAYPENYGIKDYQPILPSYPLPTEADSDKGLTEALNQLQKINPNKLSQQDAKFYQQLTRYLNLNLELNKFPFFNTPLAPNSGMQTQLPILLAEYTFRTERDITDYLALLDQSASYYESLLAFEQARSEAGFSMPAAALKEVRHQCDSIVTSVELKEHSHFLQTSFRARLAEFVQKNPLTKDSVNAYIAENDRLLSNRLIPAFTKLGDGLILLEDPSISLHGLAAYPQGKDYYLSLLISQTGSYRPIEEIRAMLTTGLEEELQALRGLLRNNSLASSRYFSNETCTLPYADESEMLANLQEHMASDFPMLPEVTSSVTTAATVKQVSNNLSKYCAPAFYLTSPLDDTEQNVIYINPLKTAENLDLYTTLAHEGFPGHLYQTVFHNRYAQANHLNPAYELLWYGGYLEGWALYCEFLSYDYAAEELSDSADKTLVAIEKHSRNLQLCLYSLIDIMIHYDNASPAQISAFLERFGISDTANAEAIYNYIAQEPCNYLKYYLGYLEILSLRSKAQVLWNEAYTDYLFHKFFLENGPADFQTLNELLETTCPQYH